MRELFADLPEACDNTLVIAQRCAFMPQLQAPILPAFPTPDGLSEEAALRREAEEGLAARLAGLGWRPKLSSAEAVRQAAREIAAQGRG